MDALAALIDGPRAREPFLLKTQVDPPWSLRIEDGSPLTVLAVVAGDVWIVRDGHAPAHLGAGDVALLRGPDPYVVADEPSTAPIIVIGPDQRCSTVAGGEVVELRSLGVRTWGSSAAGATVMLTGTYTNDGEVSRRLLDALPPQIVVAGEDWDTPLVALLSAEIARDDPGQDAVLNRLLDLVLIAALRHWFARAGDDAPRWYLAHDDPVVGPALRLLQHEPARPWTVAGLAASVGVSRAALARRFTELVGVPPMTFLAQWRLNVAADELLAPDATVQAVADRVGYTSPFTFSAAFKRAHGVSPRDYRRARLVSSSVPVS